MKRLLALLCMSALLAACLSRPDAPPTPGGGGDGSSPGDVISALARWAVYAATLGLFACVPVAIWVSRKVAISLAICAGCTIALAGLLGWIGAWWEWIAISIACTALGIGGLWLWARRAFLEPIIGMQLDDDPYVGLRETKR